MARPAEYNRDEVLQSATDLFWKKGYEVVSMNDLVETTGLNKHSMYEMFGNKAGIFSAALEHYCETAPDVIKQLNHEPFGLQSIESYLRFLAEYAGSDECIGCLVINTIVESEQVESEAFEIAQLHMSKMNDMLLKNLEVAQNEGDIAKKHDCKELADYITCFVQGLMVSGKIASGKDRMNKLVNNVMLMLKG